MSTLTVGTGQQYATIAAAIGASQDGDVINVMAGTYTNDFATIFHKITLQGVGGMVNLVATASPPNGKAILTTDNDVTIDHFAFSGTAVPDGNGAGIRYESGNLVIRNSLFAHNQNGILGGGNATGTILIQNSEFNQNGSGTGFTHNLYVGAIASLVVENSYFHDAVVGHEIKSRALSNTITGNRIQDNATGSASYSIDLPDGNVGVIRNNVIEKGPQSQNRTVIHYGGENAARAGSSLEISGNTILSDQAGTTLLSNYTSTANGGTAVTAVISGNSTYNIANVNNGAATVSNETVLTARPTLDTTPVVTAPVGTLPPGAAAPGATPISPPVEYGRAGAVVASGHILTVGAGQQFATLAAAIAAAQDGDTLRVSAGTYTNDFSEINHKLIIEGVGGMAKFVATQAPPNGKAQLTTNTDVTIRNLEFTGTAVPDMNGAGIRYQAGNLTLVNCYFHDNQEGLLGGGYDGGTIGVYDSEFNHNGVEGGTGSTHNIYVGEIGTFVARNSYFHDTPIGHEIKSRATNNILDGDLITQGTRFGSYDIDLPAGGYGSLTNSIVVKGVYVSNASTIDLGGESGPYLGSSFTATGNTFVNDGGGLYLVRDAGGYPASVSNNQFYNFGAVPRSLGGPVTMGSNTILTVKPALDNGAGYNANFASTITPTPGLVLSLSEDAYQGDAQYTVAIDGKQVGGVRTETALHSSHQPEQLSLGLLGAGPHQVAVSFLNDKYDGTAATDRNLYVEGATYNGHRIVGGELFLLGTETQSFTVSGDIAPVVVPPVVVPPVVAPPVVVPPVVVPPVAVPPVVVPPVVPPVPVVVPPAPVPVPATGLVLNVSEDAYQGDAQYTVAIDGQQVGPTRTAKVLHATGKFEQVALGILRAGPHQVAVTFLNDKYAGTAATDRNLYLDGATYNGQSIGGSKLALMSAGVQSFVATGPAAPVVVPSSGLVINVAEDAYLGDAQFTIAVDGRQVGGTYTATALHAAGQSQAISVATVLSGGAHTVGVTFLNDAYGGSPSTDRNLYVTGASYNGQTIPGSALTLMSAGTGRFGVTVPGRAPVTSTATINVSEDAYQGDAQFTIAVDGKQQGGTYTATALHGAGQTQAITVAGIPEGFTPHDIAVTFLNDKYAGTPSTDRNLYVNSIQFDGKAVPGGTASLFSAGTQHFTAVAPAKWIG